MHRSLLVALAIPFVLSGCEHATPSEPLPDPVLNFNITASTTTLPGKIVVNHDEWTLRDLGFQETPYDAPAFARNVASWFTSGDLGNFLVYSNDLGLTGSELADAMTAAGHTWTLSAQVEVTLTDLLQYNAVFVAGPFPSTTAPDNALLIDYVEAGGNVYLAGGTGNFGDNGPNEAAAWNTFLNHFNLAFGAPYNMVCYAGLGCPLAATSTHPLFDGVDELYYDNGNSVNEVDPADPKTDILQFAGPHGLFGVFEWVPTLPQSCQDILDADPSADDGEYTIYLNQQVFSVYCHDMAGTPQEYLTLVKTGSPYNFSQYTAGGSQGSNVITQYDRVRFDPPTLLVNIGDQWFSSSTGSLMHGQVQVTSMPYGVAMACVAAYNPAGVANIDLTGTPFKVVDGFYVGGYLPAGVPTFSSNDQIVDLTGGGYCGWITPNPYIYDPYNNSGGFQLDLGYIGPVLQEVEIDIKPGSDPNSINLGSNGVVTVAILSTAMFDATTVDPTTVALADAAVKVKGKGTPMAAVEDVDGDGIDDLVVHVETQGLSLTDGAAQAILTGETYGGMVIAGVDAVRIVP